MVYTFWHNAFSLVIIDYEPENFAKIKQHETCDIVLKNPTKKVTKQNMIHRTVAQML